MNIYECQNFEDLVWELAYEADCCGCPKRSECSCGMGSCKEKTRSHLLRLVKEELQELDEPEDDSTEPDKLKTDPIEAFLCDVGERFTEIADLIARQADETYDLLNNLLNKIDELESDITALESSTNSVARMVDEMRLEMK